VPTYSYACTECDNRFDAVQAFTDDALTTCPQCSGRLRKLFNSVGVVFKGSGFYRTDSRESSKSASAGSDSAATSGKSSSSDSSGNGSGGTSGTGTSSAGKSSAASGSSASTSSTTASSSTG